MMMPQARASGLKKRRGPTPSNRLLHPSPIVAVTPQTAPPTITTSLPSTSSFHSSVFELPFAGSHSPLPSPPLDFTPPSSHKRLRPSRSASPHFLLEDAFSSPHALLSLRMPSPPTSTCASPLPPSLVTDADGVPEPSEHVNSAVNIDPIPLETDFVPEAPRAPAADLTSLPSHPPSTAVDPSIWTLAEIIERGCSQQWSEQDYKMNRPSGFTGLKEQSWARLDAAIRRRRHDHESETWTVSFGRVCHNIQRNRDRQNAESTGMSEEEDQSAGDASASTPYSTLLWFVRLQLTRMKKEHSALMNRFEEECRALLLKASGQSEIE